MAVVKDFMQGGCHIIVHDDCIIKEPEEIKQIISRVSRIVIDAEFKRNLEKEKERVTKKGQG